MSRAANRVVARSKQTPNLLGNGVSVHCTLGFVSEQLTTSFEFYHKSAVQYLATQEGLVALPSYHVREWMFADASRPSSAKTSDKQMRRPLETP